MHREPSVPEAEAQVGKWLDCRARITSKELAPLLSVKSGILRNACSTSQKKGCRFGEKCSYAHRQVEEQPSKRSKKNGDKSAEHHHRTGGPVVNVYSSNERQLVCVFQDMEPPKSSSILRKSSDIRKPIQRVKFTKATARHAKIRDQNPSLGMIFQVNLISAAPTLQNLSIGLRRRQSGKSKTPVKQRGGWPKVF